MRLPIIVLACKADLEPQIEPEYVSRLLQQYRAGLVEVTIQTDIGKDKLKRSFDWLLKAVFRHRSPYFLLPPFACHSSHLKQRPLIPLITLTLHTLIPLPQTSLHLRLRGRARALPHQL